MNAVEIEEAVSQLIENAFDADEFPFAFLEAFGNKPATIKRLRSSGKNTTNKTDFTDNGVVAVLQRNNIHIATCDATGPDIVADLLNRLTENAATTKHKAKFALATDGVTVHAASLNSDEPPLVCEYDQLDDHFGYFLELAGISTVRQIRENAFDIKATGRLNRLYVELLRNNPDWDGDQRREDLNHFFARLIFCFFAEDTGIFRGDDLFTDTIRQMSEPSGDNTHFVLSEIFHAMDVPTIERNAAELRSWANQFPYVNGGLFGGGASADDVPEFTQIARSYLLHIGSLDWTQINPDIFGSMIQAVADDKERGSLGMHYTSVPNILKVLNPLFLDELRSQLDEAGSNTRKLMNLRKRLARIRVFDPACGSGNFLVVAYKQIREIEAEINWRRSEADRLTEIPLTNFRGIEIRHFAAEVARLALVIAEYQCDELHRGQRLALAEFLPLDNENWITHGNALRLNWLKVCPPTGTGVKLKADDLLQTPLRQPEIDFENEGGETFICGNPPYSGKGKKDKEQLDDMRSIFVPLTRKYGYVDYVGCWFMKSADYIRRTDSSAALVSTNSICQGRQLPQLWPHVLRDDLEITFANRSFKWSNNATHNAGVICVIIGISRRNRQHVKTVYEGDHSKTASNINAYLVEGKDVFVASHRDVLNPALSPMLTGSVPNDGGNLILEKDEVRELLLRNPEASAFVHPFYGSKDYLQGMTRSCLVIEDEQVEFANQIPSLCERLRRVADLRRESSKEETRDKLANVPHRFQHVAGIPSQSVIIVPSVSAERREWFPVGVLGKKTVVSNLAFMLLDAPLWQMAVLGSKLHLVWIATVCGKLKTDYRYSNTLGWNTYPLPLLSDQNKADLTRCAEEILLAREAHWPATVAELYDPDKMPDDLREAHDRNDEILERIYIGRRFKNNTERLETLFRMYTEATN